MAYPCTDACFVGGALTVLNYFHLGTVWPEKSFCNSFQSFRSFFSRFFCFFLLLWNLFGSGQQNSGTELRTKLVRLYIRQIRSTPDQINLISELIETHDSSYFLITFFSSSPSTPITTLNHLLNMAHFLKIKVDEMSNLIFQVIHVEILKNSNSWTRLRWAGETGKM